MVMVLWLICVYVPSSDSPHTFCMQSEYTEYEQELLGASAPDDSSALVQHGLYDDDETRTPRRASRKHVSSVACY